MKLIKPLFFTAAILLSNQVFGSDSEKGSQHKIHVFERTKPNNQIDPFKGIFATALVFDQKHREALFETLKEKPSSFFFEVPISCLQKKFNDAVSVVPEPSDCIESVKEKNEYDYRAIYRLSKNTIYLITQALLYYKTAILQPVAYTKKARAEFMALIEKNLKNQGGA